MTKLPLADTRESELETCGYCPKLCRAACPVADVEASETLTPWGKMSLAWFTARGLRPVDQAHAWPAWGCTGCLACRERCDHKNPVADTLWEARAEYFARGAAPPAVTRAVAEHGALLDENKAAVARLSERPEHSGKARTGLLVGCEYARGAFDVATAALEVSARLTGGDVRLISGCCGSTLEHAGDQAGATRVRRELLAELQDIDELIVLEPGCAAGLQAAGVDNITTLPALAARNLSKLSPLRAVALPAGPVRWHDPCQLGRGLGQYDEPRAVLGRLLGRPPEEFSRCREDAVCSGGGGLLPQTMPEAAGAIADKRVLDHNESGGGTIVTACASSAVRFRGSGAEVVDLTSLIRQGLVPADDG